MLEIYVLLGALLAIYLVYTAGGYEGVVIAMLSNEILFGATDGGENKVMVGVLFGALMLFYVVTWPLLIIFSLFIKS